MGFPRFGLGRNGHFEFRRTDDDKRSASPENNNENKEKIKEDFYTKLELSSQRGSITCRRSFSIPGTVIRWHAGPLDISKMSKKMTKIKGNQEERVENKIEKF